MIYKPISSIKSPVFILIRMINYNNWTLYLEINIILPINIRYIKVFTTTGSEIFWVAPFFFRQTWKFVKNVIIKCPFVKVTVSHGLMPARMTTLAQITGCETLYGRRKKGTNVFQGLNARLSCKFTRLLPISAKRLVWETHLFL